MKTQYAILALFTSIFLAACAMKPDRSNWEKPDFKITASNPKDIVSVTSEEGISYIDIDSPGGIGSAHFELVSGTLPEKIIARLHLKGLEEFRLLYDGISITASIPSSSAFNTSTQKVLVSESEYPIMPGHPLWLEIKIVSDQTAEKIPLEEGYFEITFPDEFNKNIGDSFDIQWVDFFR
jgi:hypothetical protein